MYKADSHMPRSIVLLIAITVAAVGQQSVRDHRFDLPSNSLAASIFVRRRHLYSYPGTLIGIRSHHNDLRSSS